MELLVIILVILVVALGLRAFTDFMKNTVEAVVYTALGVFFLLLVMKYRGDVFVWVMNTVNRFLAG